MGNPRTFVQPRQASLLQWKQNTGNYVQERQEGMGSTDTGQPIIPGEILPASGSLTLNAGRPTLTLVVVNMGDRPIQVGSHYHFFEANRSLWFDRTAALGLRLDIPAGTAIRFEPGEKKEVTLIPFGGQQLILGLNGLTEGDVTKPEIRQQALQRAQEQGFLSKEDS
jgi:urease subunit gamma/beta